ncbi:hypothetical protein [Streptomyces sp. NPDC021020]|uniref:hypothetical protein n=1 Tax=Streptomyces sp. NPDC021020 TaxID=3365109 RepID=UPI0037A1F24A
MTGPVAASALAFLLCACGGGSRESHPTHPASLTATTPASTVDLSNKAQGELTPSEHIVVRGETGAEGGLPETRIHTPDANAYVFEAACAGSGSLQLGVVTKEPHTGPIHHVICNGEALSYPFQGGNLISLSLRPDDATGILVWQVIPLPQ